jgi:3-dehydroquinate dehydratase-1
VSILPKTFAEALDLIEKAENCQVDFIEVRLDCLKNYTGLADIAKGAKAPLIATNKSSNSQGQFPRSEAERQHTLLAAAKSGFEYVDVELFAPKMNNFIQDLKDTGVKQIISYHDFLGALTTSEMHEILEDEIASGADVCKIVTTAKTIEDNLTVLNFISEASQEAKIVCFCMGVLGKPSRLLSPFFGAFFTFASLKQGEETASGQMTIQEMRNAYQGLGLT